MFGVSRLNKPQPTNIKKKVIELQVGGWIGKKFTDNHWGGCTIPLPFMVLILYWIGPSVPAVDPYVRIHESFHCVQDQGNFCFLVSWYKYAYELLRERWLHGSWMEAYKHNVYEAAAYAYEDAVINGTEPMPDWA